MIATILTVAENSYARAILKFVLVALVVGVVIWALDQFEQIDPTLKKVVKVVLIAALIIWAIFILFGLLGVSL
jgi:hypothetical protein